MRLLTALQAEVLTNAQIAALATSTGRYPNGAVVYDSDAACLRINTGTDATPVWGNVGTPAGSIDDYGGLTAPAGWLLCDGTSYLRATYAALWAALHADKGTFTVTLATPGVFTLNGHGLVQGDAVTFETTIALPTGLTAGQTYYVIATGLTANAFQVSAARPTLSTTGTLTDGAAVATSVSQSGVHTCRYVPYGTADTTHFTVPDLRGRVAVGHSPAGRAPVATLAGADARAQANRDVSHFHATTISSASTPSPSAGALSEPAITAGTTTGDANNQDAPAYGVVQRIIKI